MNVPHFFCERKQNQDTLFINLLIYFALASLVICTKCRKRHYQIRQAKQLETTVVVNSYYPDNQFYITVKSEKRMTHKINKTHSGYCVALNSSRGC